MTAIGTNWAGNLAYGAARLHEPRTVDEVRRIVAAARSIRALGSRHSFNAIADGSEELLSAAGLAGPVRLDRERACVRIPAGLRYGHLAVELERQGYALGNLASLPHITVAGSVSTGTHGSGDGNRSLAAAVVGLELVTADGGLLRLERGDADLEGAVVGLGALGVVTALELAVEPSFTVEQTVYERLPWEALLGRLDDVTGAAYSVSVFTRLRSMEALDQVWLKRRPDRDAPAPARLLGAVPADGERHPLPHVSPVNCTPQRGAPGPWHERLPHFRLGYLPSSGAELQSEYLVPRPHAVAALGALRSLAPRIAPLLQACEIRTVAGDGLWLSPAYGTDVLGLHFTWLQRQAEVESLLPVLEDAFAPYAARPHWGKLFAMEQARIAELYPRLPDFLDLARRLDPSGVFRNPFLERHVVGVGSCHPLPVARQ